MQDRLSDKVRLQHILEASKEITKYVNGVTFDEFSNSSMMLNASVGQSEIVHEYFGLDDKIVWAVIQNEIPSLIQKVETIIQSIP